MNLLRAISGQAKAIDPHQVIVNATFRGRRGTQHEV